MKATLYKYNGVDHKRLMIPLYIDFMKIHVLDVGDISDEEIIIIKKNVKNIEMSLDKNKYKIIKELGLSKYYKTLEYSKIEIISHQEIDQIC